MKQSEIIKFYSRRDVASFIAKSSENREVAVQLQGGRYGRRPQIIQFPNDVISLAREGATSFHISQEKWQDPMKISDTLTKKEFEDLRIGWDFIIDIDCPDFKISTIGAEAIIEFLKKYGICPQIKFSGNKGWHICIPAEAFPKSMKNLFPEMSNTLITYIISESIEIFIDKLKKINFNFQDFFEKNKIKPEQFYSESNKQNLTKLFGLDVQLASPRHLIRAPYSVNEKSGLVSVVIDVDEVFNFKKEFAEPKNIKDINPNFFKKDNYSETDCILLVTEAKDWAFKEKKSQKSSVPSESRKFVEFKEKVPEEFFPPCIIHILKGLTDGKKRALFILLNFLQKAKWSWPEIEAKIIEWNLKNAEPIKKGYIDGQIKWHKNQKTAVLPPNCDSPSYYKDIGICKPDEFCKGIKNPISYPKRMRRRRTYTKK